MKHGVTEVTERMMKGKKTIKKVAKAKKVTKPKESPAVEGLLEISTHPHGIFIGGDPTALRSLAKLLTWLADVDQESYPTMPDGERCHVHLHAGLPADSLTPFSVETELCRLDAKGTGELPAKYQNRKNLTERYRKSLTKKRKPTKKRR